MLTKISFLVIYSSAVLAGLVLYLTNNAPTTINLFGYPVSCSSGVIFFGAYLAGNFFACLFLMPVILKRETKHTAKLTEWQKQDHKLQAEIISDKEKQLEAKIATLEAALKQALKKN